MPNILDRVAKSRARTQRSQFRPETTEEFFAYRLAAKLGEQTAARHYAELTDQYSQSKLLVAYRQSVRSHVDPARRFHEALQPLHDRPSINRTATKTLGAIRIERRAIAAAVLAGDYLKYADARQLVAAPEKAVATAMGFLSKFCERFRFDSAVLETVPEGTKRSVIHESVLAWLQSLGIGVAEVGEAELLAAFGYPPLQFRRDMRKAVGRIYPVLNEALGAPWTHDAAALGLYVQTERLFQFPSD